MQRDCARITLGVGVKWLDTATAPHLLLFRDSTGREHFAVEVAVGKCAVDRLSDRPAHFHKEM